MLAVEMVCSPRLVRIDDIFMKQGPEAEAMEATGSKLFTMMVWSVNPACLLARDSRYDQTRNIVDWRWHARTESPKYVSVGAGGKLYGELPRLFT